MFFKNGEFILSFYLYNLQAQMESLEVIRQDYRKNSVKSSNSCVQSEDEEEF